MRSLRVLLTTFLLSASGRSLAGQTVPTAGVVDIDGFSIDRSTVDARQWRDTEKSVRKQIDIVIAAQVPPEVLVFFRSVPIRFDTTSGKGEYRNGDLVLRIDPIPDTQPVLLHELLHAFHHRVLGRSITISDAHRAALRIPTLGGQYPNAHFLRNPREFFAVTTSIYLVGRIEQPPFDCAALKREQPEFLAFLAQKFGPRDCK